jgi:DNA-binding transcriptional MerR regulator
MALETNAMLIERLERKADNVGMVLPPAGKPHLIGDLGQLAGIEPNTVRFYERAGLIAPERIGRLRVYQDKDISRLKLIRFLRQTGMPLTKIKIIVSAQATTNDRAVANHEVRKVLEDQLTVLRKNMLDLQASIESLADLLPKDS